MLWLGLALLSIFSPISLHDKFYFVLFPVPITAICFWVHWLTLLKLHSQHSFIPFFHRPLPPPSEKAMAPHSSTLAWKIPWTEEPGRLQSMGSQTDTTEWVHFHFSLSCTGEGNGNPLQCSCLGNPRDSRAWWAAVCGVAQSRTQLKWFSSSSSPHTTFWNFSSLEFVTPIGHPGSSPRSPTKMPSPSSPSGYFLLQTLLALQTLWISWSSLLPKLTLQPWMFLLCGRSPLSLTPEAMCCAPHLFLCIFTWDMLGPALILVSHYITRGDFYLAGTLKPPGWIISKCFLPPFWEFT